MNNCLKTNISEIRKGCKDNFHAFMVKGAKFDGYYDIPFVPMSTGLEINKLIAYDQTYKHIYEPGDVIHFYLDDHKFDGPKGIWNGLSSNESFKRGFDIERLKGSSAIITPDFSLHLDMPRVMQIWNVYRSRAVGFYLSKLGFNVIPNVRWTDEESYEFAFSGLYEGQTVAVGTLGCSKTKEDKILLINGFNELVKRVKPAIIIIYGPICKEIDYLIRKYGIKVIQFESETSKYYKGVTNGVKE